MPTQNPALESFLDVRRRATKAVEMTRRAILETINLRDWFSGSAVAILTIRRDQTI